MSYNTTTTYVPRKTNHVLHLILSMGSCGLWLPVWACVAIYNAFTNDKLRTVTQNVQPQWWQDGKPVPGPYAIGPGVPAEPTNPAGPSPRVPTEHELWQRRYPPAAYVNPSNVYDRTDKHRNGPINFGDVPPRSFVEIRMCQHLIPMTEPCEDCARPASFPQ